MSRDAGEISEPTDMSQSGDNKTRGQIVALPVSSSRFWRASQSDAAHIGTDSDGILNKKTPAGETSRRFD
jgi:hypothetical protein